MGLSDICPRLAWRLRAGIALVLVLTLSGCLSVPEGDLIATGNDIGPPREVPASCAREEIAHAPRQEPSGVLSAAGFDVLIWNVYKGREAAWVDDFRRLSAEKDIVIIQEAYLTETLRELLRSEGYSWNMATAFQYRRIGSGVLTAAKTMADGACAMRTVEPYIRVPKSIVVSRYPIAGSEQSLVVANVHAINYSWGTEEFRAQLARLEHLVGRHTGPLIIAGDFNTWNHRRRHIVRAVMEGLGLEAVPFPDGGRTTVMGNPLDHIYYRGLRASVGTVYPVASSDHNPLAVSFGFPNLHESL